jgi:hypothetical protein|tara:strand:+ start:40 stop:258 length:219 start_codon:yes stop_codon:yes gene_type:complete
MRRYFDNDDYPSPSSKSYKAEPSEPSVQDDTRTQDVKAGELITKDDKVVGEKAKMKAGYGQTKGLLYYKYIK